MSTHSTSSIDVNKFDEHETLHQLGHFLPAQAPLKDFIHHNTLHAFQNIKFYDALRNASKIFGYTVTFSLEKYRSLYKEKNIREDILIKVIAERKGKENLGKWKDILISKEFDTNIYARIGALRTNWKDKLDVDMDSIVHPKLFRILCSYLDQGISIWDFPILDKSFLGSLRELERNSYSSFFTSKRAKEILINGKWDISELLKIVVGDESLYKQYLFDQQFAHQGWSGMVAAVELQPETLLNTKKITLHDLIVFELLLEIDALEDNLGSNWKPLNDVVTNSDRKDILHFVEETELSDVITLWQDAFEWTFYDQVLAGLTISKPETKKQEHKSFQAMFCIDDRECSIRRYIEKLDDHAETFGTPGFFGVEFFFQPEQGKFYTKLCPAPVTPKYLIKGIEKNRTSEKDFTYSKQTHSILGGWVTSQTFGIWSGFKLFYNILKPAVTPSAALSFKHMDKLSQLTIENKSLDDKENNLQIGFTVEEMANRAEALLKSIGLVNNFASLVYLIGHGASSVNNPHYSAYDCGACSGRPGSVNSRVASFMANHPKVREVLTTRGLHIPATTQFVGGLHDTTRDEITFYDEELLSVENKILHTKNEVIFNKALDFNAKERSRRLVSIDTSLSPEKIHEQIITRSVSLFEPRPELNHATNALCIVGSRELTKSLFLDRRSFLNSYDYKIDPEGKILFNVMKPLGPVCGGINLEYFFSRVDNQKLGAGSKLPHNVMGLFGVANGYDGDLRPGLPSQMIEVHDPIRLLIIVEHFPEVVLKTIQSDKAVYEWYINEWVHLVVMNPENKNLFEFKAGEFVPYHPVATRLDSTSDVPHLIESTIENLPVYVINS